MHTCSQRISVRLEARNVEIQPRVFLAACSGEGLT